MLALVAIPGALGACDGVGFLRIEDRTPQTNAVEAGYGAEDGGGLLATEAGPLVRPDAGPGLRDDGGLGGQDQQLAPQPDLMPAPDTRPAPDTKSCADTCAPGETQCSGDSTGIEACELGGDGCYHFVASAQCGAHQTCKDAACACKVSCEVGAIKCNNTGKQIACKGPDADGCTFWDWSSPMDCMADMQCDQAVGECMPNTPSSCYEKNECLYEGQKLCMNDYKYRRCKVAYDGCLVYDCST